MHVVFDGARHVKVDEQGYLPYIAQTATERVVHDEDALGRLTVPARRSRAELGDDLLTRGLTHVLVQSQGFDAVAGPELVSDGLDGINRRRVDNLRRRSSRGQLECFKASQVCRTTYSMLECVVLAEVGQSFELPFARG